MIKYKYEYKYNEILRATKNCNNILRNLMIDFSHEREDMRDEELNAYMAMGSQLYDELIEIKCHIDTFNESVLYAQYEK